MRVNKRNLRVRNIKEILNLAGLRSASQMSLTQFNQYPVTRCREEATALAEYANNKRLAGHFNDVIIQARDKSIPANRLVLSCYSKAFETIFLTMSNELSQERNIPIQLDGEPLRMIIQYMYTGCIDIHSGNVQELLAAAQYLQMKEVKKFCFEYCESALTVENCFGLYRLSLQYGNVSDMNETLQLISSNLDYVARSENFTELSKDQFITMIGKLNPNLIKESSMYTAIITWVGQDESRKPDFVCLFLGILNLHKIPVQFLKDVVAKEPLVKQNEDCFKTVKFRISEKLLHHNNDQDLEDDDLEGDVPDFICDNDQATPTNNRILCIGGLKNTVKEIYNAKGTKEQQFPNLPYSLNRHCELTLNDYVYCNGGEENARWSPQTFNKVYRMNLKRRNLKWEEISPMFKTRRSFGAATFGSKLVVAGGIDPKGPKSSKLIHKSVELYDVERSQWKRLLPMQRRRHSHALVNAGGSLFAIGGQTGHGSSTMCATVERLDDITEN